MGLSSIRLLQTPPIPSLSSSTYSCCYSPSLPPPCTISKLQRRPQLFPSAAPPSRGWNLSRKRCALAVRAAAGGSEAEALRRILESPGIHQGPACFDALSGRLVEKAGFQLCFMSVSAARLGLPDVGLISYGEMVDQGRQITQAVSIPVIGDGDNGYGNAMNVKRTVKGFIQAGFAGIIIEDQVEFYIGLLSGYR
ncbi:hypothetical protein BHM03_00001187 [Ensete ventricosum]|nr:hypothetical protein BHM03_00001187 [Ensete ventricosum]